MVLQVTALKDADRPVVALKNRVAGASRPRFANVAVQHHWGDQLLDCSCDITEAIPTYLAVKQAMLNYEASRPSDASQEPVHWSLYMPGASDGSVAVGQSTTLLSRALERRLESFVVYVSDLLPSRLKMLSKQRLLRLRPGQQDVDTLQRALETSVGHVFSPVTDHASLAFRRMEGDAPVFHGDGVKWDIDEVNNAAFLPVEVDRSLMDHLMVDEDSVDVRELVKGPLCQPAVLFLNNVWYQLPRQDWDTLAANLKKAMAAGSLVVLGHGEMTSPHAVPVRQALQSHGFRPIDAGKNRVLAHPEAVGRLWVKA
ncbi:MAG: hypothetical protein KC462_07600 [Cyanobacteria bacterium HKST-UBA05]|nr:hypothetical protein [Cyanobacteria bacterium HKST-UBA05]